LKSLRWLWISAASLAALTLLAFLFDWRVAELASTLAPDVRSVVSAFTTGIETLFAFSKFATGGALVFIAALLFLYPRTRPSAPLMLYVGVVHLLTRLIAGVLKNVFLRPRPYEVLNGSVPAEIVMSAARVAVNDPTSATSSRLRRSQRW
jgi:hypothetical protein